LFITIVLLLWVFGREVKTYGNNNIVYNTSTKLFYIITPEGDTAGVLTAQSGRKVVYNPSDSTAFMDNPNYTAGAGLGKNGLSFYVDSNAIGFVKRYGIYSTKRLKEWDTLCTPSSANGFSVSFSHVGFTVAPSVFILTERNTNTSTLVPNVSVQTKSTTGATFNITEGNSSLVTLLGSGVLLGVSTGFVAVPSALTLHIYARGY